MGMALQRVHSHDNDPPIAIIYLDAISNDKYHSQPLRVNGCVGQDSGISFGQFLPT